MTQAEQARRFGIDKRTIITLADELEKAGIIWRQRRGTANRTYISHYQPRPVDGASTSEVHEPSSRELCALADKAETTGDERKTAMVLFQAAQAKAREANLSDEALKQLRQDEQSAASAFSDSLNGDQEITNKVQSGSPTTSSINSDIPIGDVALPICSGGGTTTHPLTTATNKHPDISASRLLRDLGVEDTTALVKFPPRRSMLLHGPSSDGRNLMPGPGLIVKILSDDGHVWSTKQRTNSAPPQTLPRNNQEDHREHQQSEETERDRRRDARELGVTRTDDQSTVRSILVGECTHPFYEQFAPSREGTE